MIEFLDNFATIWKFWMFVSFVLGLVGMVFLFIYKFNTTKNQRKTLKHGIILLSQLFLTWFIGFGSLWIIQNEARHEFLEFLDQPDLKIEINGKPLNPESSELVLDILKSTRDIDAHHSHSSEEQQLKLSIRSSHDTIDILIEQDSEIETEYWIYWDKYHNTTSEEIGRIRTTKLKMIKGS